MAAAAFLTLLLLRQAPLASGRAYSVLFPEEGRTVGEHLHGEEVVDRTAVQQALCSWDVLQAVLDIYQVGLMIDSSIVTCKDVEKASPLQRTCSADITGIINSFTAVGSFFAGAATNCDFSQTNVEAACAASIIGVISAIAGVANAGASMSTTCTTLSGRRLKGANATAAEERRLAEQGANTTVDEERRLAEQAPILTAWCALNIFQSAGSIGRAGTDIAASRLLCDPCCGGPAFCSASVSSALAAAASTASYLSAAAAHCAATLEVDNVEALCAADITHLMNELLALASSASAMYETCVPARRRFLAGSSRRLVSNSSTVAGALELSLGDLLPQAKAAAHLGRIQNLPRKLEAAPFVV